MNKEEFINSCKKIDIIITKQIYDKLFKYYEILKKWNAKFNLTTITDEKSVFLKHFYDSILLCKYVNLTDIKSLCDFGTGAGFPGMVIAIIKEQISVTLVESSRKKCLFLEEIKLKLNLYNVFVINERAEIYAKKNREKYDMVTCRAVSTLKIISELGIPMVKESGIFCPLKAKVEEEIIESKEIIKLLNATIEKIIKYELPIENSKRSIVLIIKNGKTDIKYPREYKFISKKK